MKPGPAFFVSEKEDHQAKTLHGAVGENLRGRRAEVSDAHDGAPVRDSSSGSTVLTSDSDVEGEACVAARALEEAPAAQEPTQEARSQSSARSRVWDRADGTSEAQPEPVPVVSGFRGVQPSTCSTESVLSEGLATDSDLDDVERVAKEHAEAFHTYSKSLKAHLLKLLQILGSKEMESSESARDALKQMASHSTELVRRVQLAERVEVALAALQAV